MHQVGNLQGVYHFELPDGMEEHSPGRTAALKEEAMVSFRGGWGGGGGGGGGGLEVYYRRSGNFHIKNI